MANHAQKTPIFVAPPIFREDGTLVMKRILIANRGEIACRVLRTCKDLMMTTVAVYASEDEASLHVQLADEAVCIGPADRQPYQDIQQLVEVAKLAHVDAVHPGYGYLSENADFARAVSDAGIVFIGPTPESISELGDKRTAKEYLSNNSSVPLIPGFAGQDQDPARLEAEADSIGYPVLIKASAGGGGKGMRIVREKSEFREAFLRCASEAERSFGSGHCLIEKYIKSGKHVEIQIIGDGETFISLLDRECSIQRRHQKIIEESPCTWLSPEMRQLMSAAATTIAALLSYRSAGTVEFIVDIQEQTFYFLEVNTRIQVEHPITEEVVGVDIVALQLFVAAGGKLAALPELSLVRQQGHAIEVRLCAENPFNNFLPCTGRVTRFSSASEVLRGHIPDIRYEAGVASGSSVSVHFDSMICKIIVWAPDRASAIQKMNYVLRHTVCLGITTNQLLLQRILAHPQFQCLDYTTSFIECNQQNLLEPPATQDAGGPMMMAAVLYNRLLRKVRCGKPFGSVPAGFRNQRKGARTSSRVFVSCQLQLLGHPGAAEFLVTRAADEYDVAPLKLESTLTPDEKRLLHNQQGGALTRRFYDATSSQTATRAKVRLLQDEAILGTAEDVHADSGQLRLSWDNQQHTFFVSVLGGDNEFKRAISVYSPRMAYGLDYLVSDPLNWAGKFEQREKQGDLGSTESQRRHLSPMPCHILQILAEDGRAVQRGDGLLVMESMKTEIRINAGVSGIVRMYVEKGAKISEGVLMCEVLVSKEIN